MLVDPKQPEEANWKTVLPERPEPLQGVSTAGGKLFATYLKDVTDARLRLQPGRHARERDRAAGPRQRRRLRRQRDDTFVFYTFNSLNVPPTIYRYDIATKKSTVFRQPKVPGYNPDAYETKAVFYPSKDGTKIPMFLVHKKGLKLDGTNPTLLYAYGGFNIVQSPTFSAARLALLEQGFVYANANLRGGGEYGEAVAQAGDEAEEAERVRRLHRRGRMADREQVHVDASGWRSRAARTAACSSAPSSTSGPTWSKVAIPQVGVMDMLRFHKFTIGWNWIADYGSSDDAEEFKALYAYSPLHNIKAGAKYPATLITTADHDDRVVPAHSFKYAATLQEKRQQGQRRS